MKAVTKKTKTKAELNVLVLNEMRKYPGCEELDGIRIISDPRGWFIAPIDRSVQFSEPAQRAAIAVQITLHDKYATDPD